MKKKISITISETNEDLLIQAAKIKGTNKSQFIGDAIGEYAMKIIKERKSMLKNMRQLDIEGNEHPITEEE